MDFTLHQDLSSFNEAEWNALLAESISDVPFLRHEYLTHWWKTRGGGEWPAAELILVAAREGGHLIGIAPLFLADHEGRRALLLLGSIEISDYLDLIVRAGDLDRFLPALLDFLVSSLPSAWSAIDWYNLPDASPTLTALNAESARRGWAYTEEIFHPTPIIPLGGGYEAYLESLDKKQRHEIRRKLRRADERGARWRLVERGGSLDGEIEALFGLMDDDRAKAEFLRPEMREQMRSTVLEAHSHGWLWLAFLEVEGAPAAAALNFDYRNRIWGYNSGVDRRYLDISPGWVLLAHSLQWAAENGRDGFDFMRGSEEYKYRFGAVDRHVMRVRVERA